jgi:hypothetical protein
MMLRTPGRICRCGESRQSIEQTVRKIAANPCPRIVLRPDRRTR